MLFNKRIPWRKQTNPDTDLLAMMRQRQDEVETSQRDTETKLRTVEEYLKIRDRYQLGEQLIQ